MMPSRGMGVIAPGKVPRAKRRGDDEPVEGTGKPIRHAKGGKVHSSASKRADGCAVRGKTKGKIV